MGGGLFKSVYLSTPQLAEYAEYLTMQLKLRFDAIVASFSLASDFSLYRFI